MMSLEEFVNFYAVEEILDHYSLDTSNEPTTKPKISAEEAEKMFRESPIRKAYWNMCIREESLATNTTMEFTKEEYQKLKFI
jgi:hypothetical protein